MNLSEQLRRQLKFIDASCRAYDAGEIEEALRIAVSLRVIFHDTTNSTSLLTHLGKKQSISLISTIGTGKPPPTACWIIFHLPPSFAHYARNKTTTW